MGKATQQQVLRGQHTYFTVEGSSADAAYAAARALGLKVIEFKRIIDPVPGVTEDKEIEFEDPENKGQMLKRTVKVLSDIQPQVYRTLGSDRQTLERRAKSHTSIETVVIDTFTYVVKAMAIPGAVAVVDDPFQEEAPAPVELEISGHPDPAMNGTFEATPVEK